jgi:hypothetical protein
MLTKDDLMAVFTTAFIYLKPGGVMLTLAEVTKENFHQNRMFCSTHIKDDINITFVQNYYDPDPGDTIYEATYAFFIRKGGRMRIENDRHLVGIFKKQVWVDLLTKAGFNIIEKQFTSSNTEMESIPMFICLKPEK